MYQKIILVFIILNGDFTSAASVADSWILFAKSLKDSWIHCPFDVSLSSKPIPFRIHSIILFQRGALQCFKQSTLEVFDKMIQVDVIPLAENVRLKRKLPFDGNTKMDTNIMERRSLSIESWSAYILKNIFNLLKTHTLFIGRISNEGLASLYSIYLTYVVITNHLQVVGDIIITWYPWQC